MCLLIHKPRDARIPLALLESAADYNPHGFGCMALRDDGSLVVKRRSVTRKRELRRLNDELSDQDCVFHLRYGTSGAVDWENTHPIRITSRIWMAHNGTLNLRRHAQDRSDTWHLAHDYLRPLLRNRPQLLEDRFFHELLTTCCGPHNKFVFLDAATRRTVIVNREKGVEVEGLWLSNTRWFDASRFQCHAAAPAEQSALPRGTLFSI